MTIQRTFAQRVGFYVTCVAPSETIIPSDAPIECGKGETIPCLRSQISAEGLCYLYAKRIEYASNPEEGEEDLYLAYVAASPAVVAFDHATMLLSEAQLRHCLPWDARLQGEDSVSIIMRLRAHAAALQPLVPHSPDHVAAFASQPEVTLTPLHEPIEVKAEEVQDILTALCEQGEDATMTSYRVQQAFLRSAVATLMAKLSSQGLFLTNDGAVMRSQPTPETRTLHALGAIVARVMRWHREHARQTVVKAVPVYGNGYVQTAWSLTIGVPLSVA